MWFPRWYHFFGPIVLRRGHVKRQAQLEKIVKHLQMNYAYKKWEIQYLLKSYGVHNVNKFFQALIEYGYVEHDMHMDMFFLQTRKLDDETFKRLEKQDKGRKKTWWLAWE